MVRALIGDSAGDSRHPPGGIRGELEALRIVKLTARIRPRLPSWIRSKNSMPRPTIALRDGDHQAQVRFDELLLLHPDLPARYGERRLRSRRLERGTPPSSSDASSCAIASTPASIFMAISTLRLPSSETCRSPEVHAHLIAREQVTELVGYICACALSWSLMRHEESRSRRQPSALLRNALKEFVIERLASASTESFSVVLSGLERSGSIESSSNKPSSSSSRGDFFGRLRSCLLWFLQLFLA